MKQASARPGSPRRLGLLAVGLLAGALLAGLATRWMGPRAAVPSTPARPPVAAADDPGPRAEREALRAALDAEIEARAALAQEVEVLRQTLFEWGLPAYSSLPEPSVERAEVSKEAREEVADRGGAATEPAASAASDEEQPWFDEDALLASGVHSTEIERLRERWEQFQMEKLYLRDRAAREGWLLKARHRNELRELSEELRAELGEEEYDRMLYATGQSNRVIVRDLLDRSPARRAGLEPGDAILSYDGARVFRPRDLVLATTYGKPGERVRIEVLRNGRTIVLDLPRGPLGALFRQEVGPPPRG